MWNKPKKAELARAPKLYATENVPFAEKVLYHHFYIGCCSWYLAEYDGLDTCFGYVILNGDYQNAEWGYFSMQELESIRYLGLEIIHDSSWNVCTFKELNIPHKGRLYTNPWQGINPYSEDEFIKYVPTKEDIHKVIDVATAWEKQFLEVLIHSGARLGEVLDLTWNDINFEAKSIQLWTRKRKGGSKQSRTLPLDATLIRVFNELRNEQK